MLSIAGQLADLKFNVSYLRVNNWCFEVRENLAHQIVLTSPAAKGEIVFDNHLSFWLFVENINGIVLQALEEIK